MRQVWEFITSNDESVLPFLDESTVRSLQSLAPLACSNDKNLVITLVNTGQVFPNMPNSLRPKVLTQLLGVPGMIPTFKTFFEDLKYLEPVIIILRGILPLNHEDSVRKTVTRCHTGSSEHDGYCLVQFGLNRERRVPNTPEFLIRYRQLCLHSLRYFPSMTDISPLVDRRSKKDNIESGEKSNNSARKRAWYEFARLASNLGFESKPIKELLGEDPDKAEIRVSLRNRRPKELYEISDEDFESEVDRQLEVLHAKFKRQILPDPTLTLSVDFGGEPVNRRCGKPLWASHASDKNLLFLPILYGVDDTVSPKAMLTSFAVKRFIFFCFFGWVKGNYTKSFLMAYHWERK